MVRILISASRTKAVADWTASFFSFSSVAFNLFLGSISRSLLRKVT
jgi:hypothetical protein